MKTFTDVLNFWFLEKNHADYGKPRNCWFQQSDDFDEAIHTEFHELYVEAAAGKLASWEKSPEEALALIIVLDQFPRNLFRGLPQSYATDAKAVEVTKKILANGFHKELTALQRVFAYLPLEHSENLQDQLQCVELFEELNKESSFDGFLEYAVRHKVVIEKFGRFPHRNQVLGRSTSPEEVKFLEEFPAGF